MHGLLDETALDCFKECLDRALCLQATGTNLSLILQKRRDFVVRVWDVSWNPRVGMQPDSRTRMELET